MCRNEVFHKISYSNQIIYNTDTLLYFVTAQKKVLYGMSAHPYFGLNFMLRSSVYLNMCPRVAALEITAQMAGL